MEDYKVKIEKAIDASKIKEHPLLVSLFDTTLSIYNNSLESSFLDDSMINHYNNIFDRAFNVIQKKQSTVDSFAIEGINSNVIVNEFSITTRERLLQRISVKASYQDNRSALEKFIILHDEEQIKSFVLNEKTLLKLHKRLYSIYPREDRYLPGEYKDHTNSTETDKGFKYFVEHKEVKTYVSELFKFINKISDKHIIVRVALLHAHLISIHPFNDGNGRLIRLLCNMFFKKETGVNLFIDQALSKNITEYYAMLDKYDQTNDFESTIEFFYRMYIEQINLNTQLLKDTKQFSKNINSRLSNIFKKQEYIPLFIFSFLVSDYFTVTELVKKAERYNFKYSDRRTIVSCIDKLLDENIIKVFSEAEDREKVYMLVPESFK